MKIIQIEAGPLMNNAFIVYCEETMEAAVIDVPLESKNIFTQEIEREGLTLKSILLTHSHFDHIGDCAKLQSSSNAEIYIHPDDAYRLENPNEHTVISLPPIEGVTDYKLLTDGMEVAIGKCKLGVIHTPGHTEGSVCFIDHIDKLVFSGDTLFRESVGRCDLPGGNMTTLMQSIKTKLMVLEDDYKVLPGHGPFTSIGMEKKYNQFRANFL
jgi:glyoxylase-like metal-dependent hydrolase (beta-lactamase superfamily II)